MADQPFPSIAFLWPALAAASTSGMMSALAGQFAQLGAAAAKTDSPTAKWATANRVALELPSMRLREFCAGDRAVPALICAPFALHRATIADFAPGHSLIRALRSAGLSHICVTDWLSAVPEMRYLSIDNYLADLDVAVDELGGNVDLIGLCQGGWMALLFCGAVSGKSAQAGVGRRSRRYSCRRIAPVAAGGTNAACRVRAARRARRRADSRRPGAGVLGSADARQRIGAAIVAGAAAARRAGIAQTGSGISAMACRDGGFARHLLSRSSGMAVQAEPARRGQARRARASHRSGAAPPSIIPAGRAR